MHNNFFGVGGAGGELGRGASSVAAMALEGGRRAKVGFGDEFALSRGVGAIFLTGRELLALPIGSFHVETGAGARAVYLGSRWAPARIWDHPWRTNFDLGPKISADPWLGGVLGRR
jgi:hypothetical protein